jgi:hypothetical protein
MNMEIVEREIPATAVSGLSCARFLMRSGDRPLRPYSMLLDDESSQHFLINEIRCGRDSVLIVHEGIPACVFSTRAVMEEVFLGIAHPALGVDSSYGVDEIETDPRLRHSGFVLGVTNTSPAEKTLSGKILCWQEGSRLPGKFRTVVGLGHSNVPAGMCRNVRVMPQLRFYPDRLAIPLSIGSRLVVDMVRIVEHQTGELVGNNVGGEVGDAYSERLEGIVNLGGRKWAGPGDFLIVTVRNVTDRSVEFCGAFLGEADG